jgi:DNA-binding NarL/FixJ family response regulator
VEDALKPKREYTDGEEIMTRILIADPEITTRKALALLLMHRMGVIEICEAEDADVLYHRLDEFRPDTLLLCDTLPGLSVPAGLCLLREKYPALRIGLLSVDETSLQKARACNMEFIHKGASPERTLEQLSIIIGSYKIDHS